MTQSPEQVGEKTRTAVAKRAVSVEPQTKVRREIPAAYLAKHPCKICDGKHCMGQCRF
jgi:hypothetical protein